MELLRTELEEFNEEQILKAIKEHQEQRVPGLTDMWDYYRAKNPAITKRKPVDQSNPDNKTVVSYGRKIVNTFKGYAYRPGYITYKSEKEDFLEALKHTFSINNETVKTSRTGRNTGIFGYSYELFYIEEDDTTGENKAEPRFINGDPREIMVYYDHSPEPNIVVAIRYYPISEEKYHVDVWYPNVIQTYDRVKSANSLVGSSAIGWVLTNKKEVPNYFGEVPVVAYYLGDEAIGIIDPVRSLIDDYDMLVSDSVIEFDKFAHAYLLMAKMSLTDPQQKESQSFSRVLRDLKRKRVFERLQSTDDVKFLLKQTPVDFISWLAELIRQEIHKQSHVPDFMSEKLGGDLSGVAVARLMFDFENLVSSAEGDFNIGLMERIRLITIVYKKGRQESGEPSDITISHKRNVPLNVKEFAETAVLMSNAGFSRYLTADVMPDDIIPDVEAELERQVEERTTLYGDIGEMPDEEGMEPLEATGGDVQAQALNGAQIKSMVELTQGVSDKTMAPDSAKALLLVAIPSLTPEQANAIIDPASKIEKPEPPPMPPQFGQPPVAPVGKADEEDAD